MAGRSAIAVRVIAAPAEIAPAVTAVAVIAAVTAPRAIAGCTGLERAPDAARCDADPPGAPVRGATGRDATTRVVALRRPTCPAPPRAAARTAPLSHSTAA